MPTSPDSRSSPKVVTPDRAASLPVSVVVPVFNSASTLRDLNARLKSALACRGATYEVLLVDDSSRDDSWALIERMAAEDPCVRGIRFNRNFGQHNALLCGIRAAQHEVIVTLDDDLQHPPEEIGILLDRLREGFDVVYGTPREARHGLLRNFASRMTKVALQATMGAETAQKVSAFRAFRTSLREGFREYRSPHVSIDVLLTWSTARFTAVPVRHEARVSGTSNYSLGRLTTHAFNLLTGFSTLPLQFASGLGFAFTVFGGGVLAWVLVRYFFVGSPVPGFPFLASVVSIFSGVQLFALGIIGEYLARMHFRTLDRPQYFIRDSAGLPPSSSDAP